MGDSPALNSELGRIEVKLAEAAKTADAAKIAEIENEAAVFYGQDRAGLVVDGKNVEINTVSSKLGKQGQIVTGRTPHAVGVLPSDVAEKTLEQTLKEGGITSFERIKGVTVAQDELNSMAEAISKLPGTQPLPTP